MNLKKIITRARVLMDAARDGETATSFQIESLVKEMFGVSQTRFIFIKDG